MTEEDEEFNRIEREAAMRKALQRFLDNHGLRKTVSMRQKKDYKTKSYTIWLINEPPQVVIPRGKK